MMMELFDAVGVSGNTASSVLIASDCGNFLTADIGVLIFHHQATFTAGIV
jgi:hypothetical protein